MAKNREPEKPASESEPESGDASSEEIGSGDSDSEPELTQPPKKPAPSSAVTLKKPQPQPPSSSGESESESDSESDSDAPIKNLKPIVTKAMAELQKSSGGAKKPAGSKSDVAEVVTPAKGGKRAAEEEVKDGKKKKVEAENSEKKASGVDDSKKLFQRIWSEDDEIMILKGMISYAGKKKLDPLADLNKFHDYIRKNLHFDATTSQLQAKVRRLRKKYENNKKKGKKELSKPHEQKAYELSEKIWGAAENRKDNAVGRLVFLGSPKADEGTSSKAANKKAVVVNGNEVKDVTNAGVVVTSAGVVNGGVENLLPAKRPSVGDANARETMRRIGIEMFEGGSRAEEAKEWKRLKVTMMELHLKQLEVEASQTRLVLNGLRSADNSDN